jgi:thiamine kinase-like enzyme
MVASLPGNIRLKLERTLAQWRQWDCDPPLAAAPRVASQLASGLSNCSVLVESGQRFVVRIDGVDPAAHSLNRQGEWRTLGAASRAGLSPAPRYFNPELGSLVCDYLEPDAEQPLVAADIANLLRAIHRLPARHYRLDLPERLLSYDKRLAHRNPLRAARLAPHRPAVTDVLAACEGKRRPMVLCHHDLLRANRLYSGGRLFALDWEYSAMGSGWYDLAVIAAGDALPAGEVEALLTIYLGRSASGAERLLVMQYACVYRYLELQWHLVQEDQAGLDDRQLDQKLAALAQNLREVGA